jgi:hypothetical protein
MVLLLKTIGNVQTSYMTFECIIYIDAISNEIQLKQGEYLSLHIVY